jgi:ferric-dicitrate binding protein FerR (iron transport regulator)
MIPTAAQQDGGVTQIIQQIGRAMFNIQRRATPHFGVRTPHLATVVRGTVFTVTVDEDGCRVAVTEGRVEVATHDGRARQFVNPGMQATAPAHDHSRIIIERVGPGDRKGGGSVNP